MPQSNILIKDTEKATKLFSLLYETGKIINSSINLNKVLNNILEVIEQQFDYKFSAILLVDKDRLYVRAGRGFHPDVVKDFKPKIGEGIPGNVVKMGKPLIIPDVRKDSRYIDVNSPTLSELAVPIIHEGKVIGAFNIESDKLDHFDNDDLILLQSLADQAAHAIVNGKLYDQVKNFNIELQQSINKATKDLIAANEDLEKLNKVKSDFVSIVSHELRTPLTSIIGYVALVRDGEAGDLNGQQKDFLNIVIEESERFHRLINDLLDLAKIEQKKMIFIMKKFCIVKLLNDFINETAFLAKDKGIKLELEIVGEIPPVVADIDKIKQVLTNLVTNAMKFTNPGGKVVLKAHVERVDGVDYAQIDVIDSGIGMSKEDIPKIFNKFHQIDMKANRKAAGTGLGLTITKSLVEAHQGKIWVSSRLGKGSTFSFMIPMDLEEKHVKQEGVDQ